MGLVVASRDYAASLGLDAKQTYTTYADVGRDTLLLVLQAAPRDCICPHTWKYPIVGRIPYKGFFDLTAARREADRLAARGYDVYLRPAGMAEAEKSPYRDAPDDSQVCGRCSSACGAPAGAGRWRKTTLAA